MKKWKLAKLFKIIKFDKSWKTRSLIIGNCQFVWLIRIVETARESIRLLSRNRLMEHFFPPNTAPFRHVVIFPEYEIFFVFISSCYFNSTLFIVKYKNLSFIQHKNSNKYQSLIDFSLLFLFQGFFQTKIFSKLLLLFKNLYNHQCSNRISSFIESLIKSINDSTFNLIY